MPLYPKPQAKLEGPLVQTFGVLQFLRKTPKSLGCFCPIFPVPIFLNIRIVYISKTFRPLQFLGFFSRNLDDFQARGTKWMEKSPGFNQMDPFLTSKTFSKRPFFWVRQKVWADFGRFYTHCSNQNLFITVTFKTFSKRPFFWVQQKVSCCSPKLILTMI